MRFKRQFNPKYKGEPRDQKWPTSITQPDQNLTVKTLMERHTKGIGTGVAERQEIYLQDEEGNGMEVPRIQDFTELQDRRAELQQQLEEVNKRVAEEKEALRRNREATEKAKDQDVDAEEVKTDE